MTAIERIETFCGVSFALQLMGSLSKAQTWPNSASFLHALSTATDKEVLFDHLGLIFTGLGFLPTFEPTGATGPDLSITCERASTTVEVTRFRPMDPGPPTLTEQEFRRDDWFLEPYGNPQREVAKCLRKVKDKFRQAEKTIPTILTTSQKLSTGVDARNIRNIVLMRPINMMIEFKQIIGRGTRLYDGKDYFTIYDFVKAYQHFNDPEWDGEPLDPEPCSKCGSQPCECGRKPVQPCAVCGKRPCVCPEEEEEPCPVCGHRPCVCKKKAKVKLADGKERAIQHMMSTTFWHTDGTPISAQQFLELLFGKLPEFFKNEEQLRELWSAPDTRKSLLEGLAEKGFGHEQLAEMQKIIDAEKSDLFDVLAYVAYALPSLSRQERAARAKVAISKHFTSKQQGFLDFVLAHYIGVGVDELDQEKLTPLLRLKYRNSIADAVADLGKPEEIGKIFAGFQKYLYQPVG